MSGALQAVYQNLRSFIPPVPAIGSAYGGGYFAGQISTAGNGIANYNLVVGPVASAQSRYLQWKTNRLVGDPTSVIDGPANSTTMNSATYPAAQFCKAVSAGGFSDWYMPAKNELEVCYYNLKPSTTSNVTTVATNANAVPARASNYTAGTPAQTSATNFRTTGAEGFDIYFYWASTQGSPASCGRNQNFANGLQWSGYKNYSSNYYIVRAIRRVAV